MDLRIVSWRGSGDGCINLLAMERIHPIGADYLLVFWGLGPFIFSDIGAGASDSGGCIDVIFGMGRVSVSVHCGLVAQFAPLGFLAWERKWLHPFSGVDHLLVLDT